MFNFIAWPTLVGKISFQSSFTKRSYREYPVPLGRELIKVEAIDSSCSWTLVFAVCPELTKNCWPGASDHIHDCPFLGIADNSIVIYTTDNGAADAQAA
jgi:hypothetical protein